MPEITWTRHADYREKIREINPCNTSFTINKSTNEDPKIYRDKS